ncbi:alpha/beta hydrolase [Leptospira ryugenii]|uniref:Alpha/beta hydrolase n=2 Tax=Leptospira ryugenii TaxID=1917863 RepID=A0A2P2E318_9LEPT|nr:alpha/beta hydrolase [Leptospira ryugenii]
MGAEPHFIDLDGISLFYWKFPGNPKDPLVFLHGLLDEGFSMRRIIKEVLSEKREIYVFDLPGYGKSQLPKIKYLFQIDVWADLLLEAITKLHLTQITLVGHSMGGLISQHIVLKSERDLIRKLVLLAPGGIPHPDRERMQRILFPKSERDVTDLLKFLYGAESPEPGLVLRKTLVSIWNGWENLFLQENTIRRETSIFHGAAMKGIQIPTLILAGDQDEITPPDTMKLIHRYIKKSKLIWILGAKHAIHLERPKEIANALIKF